MCVTYLCSSSLASAGPAVRNPPGAPGAEGQPEGGPEGEGAASDGEAGQCSLCGPCAHPKEKRHRKRSKRLSGLSGLRPPRSRGLTVCWFGQLQSCASLMCECSAWKSSTLGTASLTGVSQQASGGKKSARSISSPDPLFCFIVPLWWHKGHWWSLTSHSPCSSLPIANVRRVPAARSLPLKPTAYGSRLWTQSREYAVFCRSVQFLNN